MLAPPTATDDAWTGAAHVPPPHGMVGPPTPTPRAGGGHGGQGGPPPHDVWSWGGGSVLMRKDGFFNAGVWGRVGCWKEGMSMWWRCGDLANTLGVDLGVVNFD